MLKKKRINLKNIEEIGYLYQGSSDVFCDSFREKYVDRPCELKHVTDFDKMGIFLLTTVAFPTADVVQ